MPSNLPSERLNVVILYESMRYVGRAMAAYLHLMAELADELAPEFCLWRLDVAMEPGCAVEAERDFAAAGMIIVAINGHQPCPPVFQRWRGDRDGEVGPPACPIIAFVEVTEGPAPAKGSWDSILRVAATQIHPEVFVWNSPEASDHWSWAATALTPLSRAGALLAGNQHPNPGLQP
jgi:hypothetical protein